MAGMIYSLITEKIDREAIEFAMAVSCLKCTLEDEYDRKTAEYAKKQLGSGGSGGVRR